MRLNIVQDKKHCPGCPLSRASKNRTKYVPTDVYYTRVGEDGETPEVDVLVIGEPVGKSEDLMGSPFAGGPSNEIQSALDSAGFGDSYALANVVRCRSCKDDGTQRVPSKEEQAACLNYLYQDIEILKPKAIVAVGKVGAQILKDHPEWQTTTIGKLRGQIHVTGDGVIHAVTVDPAQYIKSESATQRRRFFRHIKALGRKIQGKHTPYSALGSVELITDIDRADEVLDWYENECDVPVAVDYETKNLNHVAHNAIATIQFSADNDKAHVFPVDHGGSPWTKEQNRHIKKRLRRLLGSNKTKIPCWIMHNAQFDRGISYSILKLKRIAKPVIDTLFLAYLQDENLCGDQDNGARRAEFVPFSLKVLARELLGYHYYDFELSDAIAARSGAVGGSLWDLPLDRLSEYGGADAYVTRRLFCYYRRWLKKQGYTSAVRFSSRFYSRVSHLLTKMSIYGFPVDREQLEYLKGPTSPILERIEEIPDLINASKFTKAANKALLVTNDSTAGMRPLFGKEPWTFSLRKKDHLLKLFVDSIGLKPISYSKKTKEPNLDKAFLEEYKDNELVALYKEYTGLYKLRSSYLDSISGILDSKEDNAHDGRVHARFHATRTVTGRLASSDPNLQQLPKGSKNDAKAAIRSIYGASEGHLLLECDFGQAEVRWWAQIAGDLQYAQLFKDMKALRDLYKKDGDPELGEKVSAEADIHKKVAGIMFKKSVYDVTKGDRKRSKSLCFACIYGQHAKTLASLLHITTEDALNLQQTFISEFGDAGTWLTEIEKEAAANGYVSTPMGRRRHLRDLFSKDNGAAKRRARNSPIQAVSSDTTALCAWRILDRIEREDLPFKVINCVHDAVTLEVPLDYDLLCQAVDLFQEMMVDTVPEFLKEEFGIDMIVPMEIDYDLGVRWGHMLPYDGVRSSLKGLLDQCIKWDKELSEGTPWHEISYRDFDYWSCKNELGDGTKCGTENHDSVSSCSSCGRTRK